MTSVAGRARALTVLVLFVFVAGRGHADAQTPAPQRSLTMPVSGASAKGETFTGTIAINRFEARDNSIVAIGFISGTLADGKRQLGTALVGEVVVPVTVRSGGVKAANTGTAMSPRLSRVALSVGGRVGPTVVQAAGCQIVDVVLGPFTTNVLGIDLLIPPVEIHLTGDQAGPLGDLVCEVSRLIGNVAGLVGVLNNILALLIALLGGGLPGV